MHCPGRLEESIPDVAGPCTPWDARSVPMPVAPLASSAGAAHGTACPWPPTGTQQARKPAGGFIDCPVDYLTLPWWVYQQGAIALGTLRVWLGTLQRLEDLGLLAWSPPAIQFLPHARALREALTQDSYQTLRAQLAPGLRWV